MLSKPKERQFTYSCFKANRDSYRSAMVFASMARQRERLLASEVCATEDKKEEAIKVVLIRHCKVKYDWRSFYSSAEFDRACREYDRAPIEAAKPSAIQEAVGAVYISRLERSKSTAFCLYRKAEPKETELLDEVPLRSGFDTELRLPLWFWNLTGRTQWFLNHPRQAESRRLTERRAKKMVAKACGAGEDCILVTHGFYMHTLIKEFQKSGFQTKQQRVHYQNGQGITLWLPTPREGQA